VQRDAAINPDGTGKKCAIDEGERQGGKGIQRVLKKKASFECPGLSSKKNRVKERPEIQGQNRGRTAILKKWRGKGGDDQRENQTTGVPDG